MSHSSCATRRGENSTANAGPDVNVLFSRPPTPPSDGIRRRGDAPRRRDLRSCTGVAAARPRRYRSRRLARAFCSRLPFAASLEREARLLAELDRLEHCRGLRLRPGRRMDWCSRPSTAGPPARCCRGRARLQEAASVGPSRSRAIAHAHERHHPPRRGASRPASPRLGALGQAPRSPRPATRPDGMQLPRRRRNYAGPSYMSPEQILTSSDPRNALFPAHRLADTGGRRPFKAPDERNEALRIRSEPPPAAQTSQSRQPSTARASFAEKDAERPLRQRRRVVRSSENPARELSALHASAARRAPAPFVLRRDQASPRKDPRVAPRVA